MDAKVSTWLRPWPPIPLLPKINFGCFLIIII